MGMEDILVNHSGLDQAADDMGQAVNALDNRLGQLDNELSHLTNQHDWTGSAQTSYDTAKRKWNHTITEMRLALGQAGQTVSNSNIEYGKADQRGAVAFEI